MSAVGFAGKGIGVKAAGEYAAMAAPVMTI